MNFILSFCFLVIFSVKGLSCEQVDPNLSYTWGPGLNPIQIQLPTRYFFVQLTDSSAKNLSVSPLGKLEVYIGHPEPKKHCRVWSEILNRQDGSFIIRYKLYENCDGLKIDLRYENKPFKNFPIVFKGPILNDNCNCPLKFDIWRDRLKCLESYEQINQDLKKFTNVNFKWLKTEGIKRLVRGSTSICFYAIKENKVYRSCHGQYVGFHVFMDSILVSLARKLFLPDLFMLVNLGDWPLQKVMPKEEPLPIFSWCGSNETLDIVMPTYDLTESTLEAMSRVQLDMLSVQGHTGPQWSEKIPKMVWRGRDSCRERLELIRIGRQHPDLFNVSLTDFFFFRDEQEEFGPKEPRISFFEFFNFKYQMNVDGSVAAYRLPYLMAGDSLVFKQDSPYYEHWYRELRPNRNFIPIKRDLSDLVNQLNWALKFDKRARKIARAGQQLVRELLMPEHVFCYYATLLKEWSAKIDTNFDVPSDMELVPQPEESQCECPTFLHDEL